MKLLWLDVETTGLDPEKHRLLEVAAYVTDLEKPFERESPVVKMVLPISAKKVEKLDSFIVDMHTKNGLLAECVARDAEMVRLAELPMKNVEGTPSIMRVSTFPPTRYYQALTQLEGLLSLIIPSKERLVADLGPEEAKRHTTAIAGSSIHFDLSFLRVHLPRTAKNLSHRTYDVSSVKLFCRSLGMPKLPPESAHRALADVEESVRHAKACADWMKSRGVSPDSLGARVDRHANLLRQLKEIVDEESEDLTAPKTGSLVRVTGGKRKRKLGMFGMVTAVSRVGDRFLFKTETSHDGVELFDLEELTIVEPSESRASAMVCHCLACKEVETSQ